MAALSFSKLRTFEPISFLKKLLPAKEKTVAPLNSQSEVLKQATEKMMEAIARNRLRRETPQSLTAGSLPVTRSIVPPRAAPAVEKIAAKAVVDTTIATIAKTALVAKTVSPTDSKPTPIVATAVRRNDSPVESQFAKMITGLARHAFFTTLTFDSAQEPATNEIYYKKTKSWDQKLTAGGEFFKEKSAAIANVASEVKSRFAKLWTATSKKISNKAVAAGMALIAVILPTDSKLSASRPAENTAQFSSTTFQPQSADKTLSPHSIQRSWAAPALTIEESRRRANEIFSEAASLHGIITKQQQYTLSHEGGEEFEIAPESAFGPDDGWDKPKLSLFGDKPIIIPR